MLYIKYEEYKSKYREAVESLKEIVDEKELLFLNTQPKATDYSKERVSGGVPSNTFDTYIIKDEKGQIDKRLKEALEISNYRKILLDAKREDLEQSKDWLDIIYKYRFVYRLSIRNIERRIPFSRSEICRKIRIVKDNIKAGTK